MSFAPANGPQAGTRHSPREASAPVSVGGGSFKWAVGITAAPRAEPTLVECVKSLNATGWTPIVQAEPGVVPPPGAITEFNAVRLGAFHNFRTLCERLLATDADTILTVQDDALFHPDSRAFAESILWPSPNAAFVSLYTARLYSFEPGHVLRPPGIYHVDTPYLWGNLAVVWPRGVLEAFVSAPWAKAWRGTPQEIQEASRKASKQQRYVSPALRHPGVLLRYPRNRAVLNPYPRGTDVACGMIANELGREMWFVDPSPVQHIAAISTIRGHGDNTGNRNCLRPADHSLPLREQVFSSCQEIPSRYDVPNQGALP